MNGHILTNYGIIRTFHDNGKNIIDTLLPFVEYGISLIVQNRGEYYDKKSLRDLILEKTGVKIPELTLVNLLKKLEKQKIVQLLNRNQYFKIIGHLDSNIYLANIESSERRINKFLTEYKNFAKDERNDETIKEFIFNFIRAKTQKYGAGEEEITAIDEFENLYKFIQFIYHEEDELVKVYQDINFGYTLCSLLEKEENLENIKLKDFKIYLDSNFILRLLDLQEECYFGETKELFNLLVQSGAKLVVFDETLTEVESVIEYYKQKYIKERDIMANIIPMENVDGVYGAFFRRKLTITDIDDIISNLRITILDLGIDSDQISRYKLQINTEEIDLLFERKYKSNNGNSTEYQYKKCKNYISIINIIKWKRERHNIRAKCFGESKYVFLTCDWKLYKYNLGTRASKANYPEIIIQEAIVDSLMLYFPESYADIATELVLSVYQSSRYFNVNDLETLAENIQTIVKDDPTLSDYVIKATRNIDNVEEIVKLYDSDEQDHLTGLRKLAVEQKEREQQQKMDQKRDIATMLDSRYKSGLLEGKKSERENICRQLAKQKVKLYNNLKWSGIIIFGIIGPLLIIVLILGNIINLENLNIGDTAKWIMSPLIAIIGVAITAFGKELFQFDEQKIFDKLFRKYNKK